MEESTSKQDPCPYCGELHTGPCGSVTPPRLYLPLLEPIRKGGAKTASPSAERTPDGEKGEGTTGRTVYNFLCEICSKLFNTRRKLAQHRYTHTGHKPFVCSTCSKSFTSKFKLVRHLLIHSDAPLYTCNFCTRAFHRKDHLKTHLRTHGPQKTINCSFCSKRYSCEASYKRHKAFHAAQDGQLSCQLCRYVAKNKDDILHHLKTHSGSRTLKTQEDKKFKCPNCDRMFFTQKDVRRHSVVHTRRRDYLCQFCPQRFGRRDHLVRHIRKRHSGSPDDDEEESIEEKQEASFQSENPPRTSDPLPDFTSVFIKLEPLPKQDPT